MSKILISRDDAKINQFTQQVQVGLEKWQRLYDTNKALGVIKLKSMEDLQRLAEGGETYVRERLANELPAQSFGMFKLKKAAAVDLLDLPDFTELNSHAAECRTTPAVQYYKLSGDSITVNQDRLNAEINTFCVIAETAKQRELHEAHCKAAEALSKIKVLTKDFIGVHSETMMRSLFTVTDDAVEPNPYVWERNYHHFKQL